MTAEWKLDPAEWDWSRAIFDHVDLFVSDLRESVRFYETVLQPLGLPMIVDRGDSVEFPNFGLVGNRPTSGPMHLAFRARTQDAVHVFHDAGVRAGFRDNGAPGYRPEYQYYAAFLFDPDGNNVEAVYRPG